MPKAPTIELLAQPTWAHLDAHLGDAVARDPSTGPLVDVIRRPVHTLDLLWRDALSALQGDPLAAERLSVTIQAASDAAALVAVAAAALDGQAPTADEHRPGLLRLRALAILIAAVYRTQSPMQAGFSSLVIAGLVLQCGPAERLARLEPYGAPAEAYDNLLRLSVPPIVAAGVASRVYLRGYARDPVELARWVCLFEVLAAFGTRPVGSGAAQPAPFASAPSPKAPWAWGIAHADGIDEVRLADDGKVELIGTFPWLASGDGPPHFDPERHAIAGVTAHQTVELGSDVELVPLDDDDDDDGDDEQVPRFRIRVRFASPVAWVGFVDRDLIVRANAIRGEVRKVLAAVEKVPCIAGEPGVAAGELLPDYTDAWPIAEAPPRTATNQLPEPAAPEDAEAPADPDRDRRITVVAVPVAAIEGPPPPPLDEVERIARAAGHRLGVTIDVVTLPWIEDAAAVMSSVPKDDDDPRVAGLLETLARAAARTPGREAALWIAIVPGTAGIAVAYPADAALGVGVATAAGLARCIASILEAGSAKRAASAQLAQLTAGRLVVPVPQGAEPASPRARLRPPATRLRVIGRLTGTALELLERPREETRGAGAGAPSDTGVVAVALDRAGAELTRTPIHGHRAAMPTTFAALIPVAPEVDLIELRAGRSVLARIERTLQPPTPPELELDEVGGVVSATWTTPEAARPVSLTVEITATARGDDAWVPLTELCDCAANAQLPLWRLDGARRVRVVACDGWNAVASEPVPLPEGTRFGPCVIRRVNDRTLWAELPVQTKARWFTLVSHVEHGRRLDLRTAAAGEVRLTIADEERTLLADVLELEQRDVYRRA